MSAADQLARYRELMGADAVARQFEADGRRGDGVCKTCGALFGQKHKDACAVLRRPIAERVR